jgi:hypothetical protein
LHQKKETCEEVDPNTDKAKSTVIFSRLFGSNQSCGSRSSWIRIIGGRFASDKVDKDPDPH